MSVNLVGRRYARALLLSAVGREVLPQVVEEAEAFAELMTSSRELSIVLANPAFDVEERKSVVRALAEKAGYQSVFRDFLLLVTERDRITAMPVIARILRELSDERDGVLRGTVHAPTPLGDAKVKLLADELGRQSGRTVILTEHVDATILGGFRVRVGSQLYDATVNARFERLRESISRQL